MSLYGRANRLATSLPTTSRSMPRRTCRASSARSASTSWTRCRAPPRARCSASSCARCPRGNSSVLVRLAALAAVLAFGPDVFAADENKAVLWPDVKVGDQWVYRRIDHWHNAPIGTYEMRVTFVGTDGIQVINS